MAAKKKATKAKKGRARKSKPAAVPALEKPVVAKAKRELSEATYTERRDARISHYYFVRRVTKPPVIYDYLVQECRDCLGPDVGSVHSDPEDQHKFIPLISANRGSGLRMVQSVVMRIRQDELTVDQVRKLELPIETKKVRATWEDLLQIQMDVLHDQSTVMVQKVSPSGDVVTVEEPRYSQLEKGKAGRAAMLLNEKLGKLAGVPMVAEITLPDPGGKGKAAPIEPYTFSFPNVTGAATDLSEMIALNLDPKKVN